MSEEGEGTGGGGGEAAEAASWDSGLSEEHRGFLSNKGFEDPSSLITGYQQLEGHLGVPADRLVKLPGDDGGEDAWGEVYQRLGRPESPEKYDFGEVDVPEGQVDLTPWFREQAFKAGLSQEKAGGMIEAFGEFQKEIGEKQIEAQNLRDQAGMAELQKEWGEAFEEKQHVARLFTQRVGWPEEAIHALQDTMGEAWLYKEFSKLGAGIPEASFARGEQTGARPGSMTPGEAQSRIKSLRADSDWMEKWQKGDADKVSEMSRLQQIANPPKGDEWDPVTQGGPPR